MPKTVKVGPHTYAIDRISKAGQLGECDFTGLRILVKPRLCRSKAQEVLLHEVLHATTHPTLNTGVDCTDEDFVLAVSPLLLSTLQENPELVKYLLEK